MPWREKRLRCLSRPFESSGGDRRSVDHLERRRRRLSRDPVDGVPENYRALQLKRISEFMRKEAFEYFWMTWKPRSCRTRRFSRRTDLPVELNTATSYVAVSSESVFFHRYQPAAPPTDPS